MGPLVGEHKAVQSMSSWDPPVEQLRCSWLAFEKGFPTSGARDGDVAIQIAR